MITTIVVVLVIYFAAMVGIGVYGSRYSKDFSGYLSMGRQGGLLLIMGGAIGAHIGNGFVVGGAAEGASLGLTGAAYGLACASSYIFTAFFLSDFIHKGGYMSLAEYTHKRYTNDVPGIVYDLATAISSFGLAASQIIAGKALFEALGLNGTIGAIAIAVVVLAYSQLAGLWGAFATSVVQTGIILVGLVLTTVVLLSGGAVETISNAIDAGTVPDTFLTLKGMSGVAWIVMVVPVWLGMITDQPTFQRVNSAKSAWTSKLAHIISAVLMVPLAIMPAFIGAYGAAAYGAEGSSSFFVVVMNKLPAIVAAILIAAALAAVMSTVDCGIITMSTVLTRDIGQNVMHKEFSEKQLSKITVVLNVVFIGISTILALNAGSIVDLLNSVYSFLAAACFVPFVGGIIWKRGNTAGAIAASVVGVLVVVVSWLGVSFPLASIFPILPSAIAFVVVSLVTKDERALTQN